MYWVAGLVVAAIGAVAILLFTPIKLHATWAADEKRMTVRYLGFAHTTDFVSRRRSFRWFGVRLRTAPAVAPKKKPTPRKPRQAVAERPGQTMRILSAHRRTIWLTLKRILRYVGRLLTSPRLRFARLDIVGGSGNPALTGMYYGWYHSLRPAWSAKRITVNWEPRFDRREFSARFEGELWLFPWHPARHTIRLLWELPKLKLYCLYREIRKQEA
jgi:hypothetical protein